MACVASAVSRPWRGLWLGARELETASPHTDASSSEVAGRGAGAGQPSAICTAWRSTGIRML
eukprot:scaffold19865_cov120-Isochrysis_galbana.AAC.3